MIRIMMRGCNGKMGQCISRIVAEDPETEMVAGIDIFDDGHNPYPVFKDIRDCNDQADCLIDFSGVTGLEDVLDYCVEKNLPCVLCTTGLSKEQLDAVTEASKKVAILKSANMSLGINLLLKMLKDATNILAPAGFDIEIVEKHHNLKKDAPSGTALALADSINEELNNEYEYVFDRSQRREQRPKKEIGLSAVRGGTIVGDHDVIFAGEDEVITFSHTAYSKAVFGKGAVQAAKFLAGKGPGYYTMSNVIDASL
ncbi:MAG: 4-hydroxy-tetrahydrodipicolinate reductase [Lachnospiraceae bacterium]|nr:4-hydroxy-tetrahydrodipicolinate reductase [Lachnospiraceae bacterium]MBP5670453.1 4-hydroxy-tetrahydrodipicolinate reductase [Lachnospiraceae bacterium]MBP5732411.1 4-hydroxy-tetrahydrodipicolinate reductase [Lachnospiraceae bacterium]